MQPPSTNGHGALRRRWGNAKAEIYSERRGRTSDCGRHPRHFWGRFGNGLDRGCWGAFWDSRLNHPQEKLRQLRCKADRELCNPSANDCAHCIRLGRVLGHIRLQMTCKAADSRLCAMLLAYFTLLPDEFPESAPRATSSFRSWSSVPRSFPIVQIHRPKPTTRTATATP